MRKLSFVLFLMLSISLFQSCEKDPIIEPNEEVAPELPAQESFIMPFNGFENADTSGIARNANQSRTVTTFRNWFYSATNVVVWNTVLTLNLIVPVAAFHESFKHQAEFQGNKTWLWAYDFTGDDGSQYSAELFGKILDSGDVEWNMYVSKAGGFQNVNWYTGVTAEDRSHASWTLNHQPNNPKAFIGIEYNRDNTNKIESIRYTNIIPGNADNGDYIEFQNINSTASDYNKSYDVYRVQMDNLLEIRWNDPGNDGRVKDPNHFGDTDWHCWDQNLMDVDC